MDMGRLDAALSRLGLERGYTRDELHGAYRRIVRELHPDLATGDDDRAARAREMAAVNRDYRYLMGMVGKTGEATPDADAAASEGEARGADAARETSTAASGTARARKRAHAATAADTDARPDGGGVRSGRRPGPHRMAFGSAPWEMAWLHPAMVVAFAALAVVSYAALGPTVGLYAGIVGVVLELATRVPSWAVRAVANAVGRVACPFASTVAYGARYVYRKMTLSDK